MEKQGIPATGPARLTYAADGDRVTVGVTTEVDGDERRLAEIHWICTDEGILVRFAVAGRSSPGLIACWPLPRWWLDDARFDTYTYWDAADQPRGAALRTWAIRTPTPAFPIGASAATPRPGSASASRGHRPLGVERHGPGRGARRRAAGPRASHAVLQRYDPAALYFYSIGVGDLTDGKPCWGWLAPFPARDPAAAAAKVERLVAAADRLIRCFKSIAPPPDPQWGRPPAEFPAALRRGRPVERIEQAMVYTINEPTVSAYDVVARAVGSDLLIRGWFKWRRADDWARLAPWAEEAHRMAALFGGGITCSAVCTTGRTG